MPYITKIFIFYFTFKKILSTSMSFKILNNLHLIVIQTKNGLCWHVNVAVSAAILS